MKVALSGILHSDQRACLDDCYLGESIRLAHDLIDFADEFDLEGAIISIDQEKAFDRVEWGYLDMCLKKYGFLKNFREWITILYKKAQSSILTNGFMSAYFKISRSVRQGCPIAPHLYILQAEPMANAIRKSKRIKGITLPTEESEEMRISMFADDTLFFHRTEKSIIEGFKILHLYSLASGAKINVNKTKGLYIRKWKGKHPLYKDI
jgi:hypothetical protein